MRNFLLVKLWMLLSICSVFAQSGIKYGSSASHEAGTIIKTDATHIYVIGGMQVGSDEYGIITKFTKGTYTKVWQKRLDFPSRVADIAFVDSETNPTEIYLVGQSLPEDADNQSFLLKMATSDGSLLCTRRYNHTGREAFTRIVKHQAPVDAAFPFYILGRKQNPVLNETQFDVVILWNINGSCSGNFIKWSREYFLDQDNEFFRGLVDLNSGDLLLTGNRRPAAPGTLGGLVVKVDGAGNVSSGMQYNQNLIFNDGDAFSGSDNVMLVGEHTLSSGTKFANATAIFSSLNVSNAIDLPSLESLKNAKYHNSTGIATIVSTGQKPKDGSLKNNTAHFVEILVTAPLSSTIRSLNHISGTEYISSDAVAEQFGKAYYTDGRLLSSGTYDTYIAESDLTSTFQDFICQDDVINGSHTPVTITTTAALPSMKIYQIPQPSTFSNVNFELPSENWCGVNCTLSTNIIVQGNSCQNGPANTTITGGSGTYTYQWDLGCNGTIDGTASTIVVATVASICVTVTDVATGCTATAMRSLPTFDNIPPVIDCPDNVTLKCGEAITAANTGNATATDDSGGIVTITASLGMTNIVGCTGTTLQTFVATDICGNSSSCVQIITTIHDTSPPIFTNCGRKVILNGIVDANGNCGRETVVVAPDVIDNCLGQITITNTHVPGDEDASGYYLVGTTYVTFTATDACGNSVTCQDTIIILPCGQCEGLSATLTPVSGGNNGKCCYNLNVNNAQGPGAVDGICFDMITADWIMNTVTSSSGYTFTAGSSSGDFACIENASGIPFGFSTVATICMAELSPMANDTQCIQISWINNLQNLGCLDTLKTFCEPPIEQKDTCFAITNMVIECDPNDDYSYCVSMKVTNLGPNGMAYFKLDALPPGFTYDDCPACTGIQGNSWPSGQWYFNMGLLPTNGTADICFKIKSAPPILSPTPVYTLGNAEGLNWCCHSPKPICFNLKPCCDPCEDISVTLTPLQNQDTCCYRLDLKSECDYKVFDKIELDLLTAGVEISSFAVLNSAWTPMVKSPGHKICFAPTSGSITPANDGALLNFCISGVDNPSETPQYLNINYYSKDSILCDTLLRLECEDKDSKCVVVTNQEVECDTVNKKYIFTMTVDNNSSPAFTATDFVVFPMTGGTIVPTPIPFSPPLSATGAPQTVTFCYVPTTFPDANGYVVFVYKLVDTDGHCCEGGEIFYDTIPLPDCVDSCFFLQCAQTKYQFDVETRPLGNVTAVANFGIFPYQNFPNVVKDGCNGTNNSVQLFGVTRGYAGEAIGVKQGGVMGLDTLGKEGEECCLTYCHKMRDGLASTSATLEVYVNGFLPGQTQLLGYYTYANDVIWDETQILFVHPFNVKEIIFRNVSSDPLDGPPSIFIDGIRLGMAARVKDVTPPVINCPSDFSVTGSGTPCTYNYTMPSISATDNSGHLSMNCTIDGSPAFATTVYSLAVGIHNVQCIAIDSCKNADTCLYRIIVGCNNDTLCTCPSQQSNFTLISNGVNYNVGCNNPMATAPKLGCPPADVKITGSFACQGMNGQNCENRVHYTLDRPGTLSDIAESSTIFGAISAEYDAADVSSPGVYCLSIYTICPGSSDTCRCKITWVQTECPDTNKCICSANQSSIQISTGGNPYNITCNNTIATAPKFPCPANDLYLNGVTMSCIPMSPQDSCDNIVFWTIDRPSALPDISFTASGGVPFTFFYPAVMFSTPGIYTLTMSTVCPGSPDTCRCTFTWIQEACPNNTKCTCPSEQTTFNLMSNGVTYPITCGNPLSTAPTLGCPPKDVKISGNFACQKVNSQDSCNNTVSFSLDRPGTLPNISGFGLSPSISLTFPASDVSAPGIYTLTISTVCPGNIDTCVCVLSWIQKECPVDPICKCGGFSKTKFCLINTGTTVETECNLQNKVYNLPCPGASLVNYCGTFKCNPDTCSPTVVNFILTNTNTGATIHTASLSLNPMGKFTINLLPAWCNDPSVVYEIKVSGVCGNDTCVCITKFRVDCPQQSMCKCDQKFNADVANGYTQTNTFGSCVRRFKPNNLCPNDKVDWYRNGVYVTSTSGITSTTFGVFAGYGRVCMVVTRIESPNKICKDTFCSNTFCVPEGLAKCPDIDNSEMSNNIDGYIDDDGTMNNWKKEEGWPYAFAGEGLSDGNIMLIASKDMPSSARTNRNGAPPKEGFLTFVADAESYLSTPIPVGTLLELEGITVTGQRVLISTFDVSGIKKGWNGSIKREISMPEEIYSVVLRLSSTSTEPALLRIDNLCFEDVVGTDDNKFENNIVIYPNPTTGILNLEFANALGSNATIEVIDVLGKVTHVTTIQRGESSHQLDLSPYTSGMYLIKVTEGNHRSLLRKLIKLD